MDANRIIKSAGDTARNLFRDESESLARLAYEVGLLQGHIRGLCASLERYTDPFMPGKDEETCTLMLGDAPIPTLIDDEGCIAMVAINGVPVEFGDLDPEARFELMDQWERLSAVRADRAREDAYLSARAA